MPLKKILIVASFTLTAYLSYAQQYIISILDSGRKTSIRGLSVVDDDIVWASGSNGTVARSVDGGKTFEWLTVAGYEKRDFRDIEAFDKNTAVIMGIAEPAIILKTKDGGKSWYKVFEDSTKGMFLDAMDFFDKKNGIVIGDPINDSFFLRRTNNGGETWKPVEYPKDTSSLIRWYKFGARKGQAFFAASGTNIKMTNKEDYVMVTGGTSSESIDPYIRMLLPIIGGKETTGANSIAVSQDNHLVVVGGDFNNDTSTNGNCGFGGRLNRIGYWQIPNTPPHGYRSCVEYITKVKLITCGTSGVDISNDGGMNWELISTQSFHVCQKAKKGTKVFLAGGNGKIAMLEIR